VCLSSSAGLASDVLTVRNLVNIRSTKNYELAMRLVSDVDNGNTFFTDLNGFQVRNSPGCLDQAGKAVGCAAVFSFP
jgi:hypothetical protein